MGVFAMADPAAGAADDGEEASRQQRHADWDSSWQQPWDWHSRDWDWQDACWRPSDFRQSEFQRWFAARRAADDGDEGSRQRKQRTTRSCQLIPGPTVGVFATVDPAAGATKPAARRRVADNRDEVTWQRRQAKRRMSIEIVKASPAYQGLKAPAEGPDPEDRTIGKRQWERLVTVWKEKIRSQEECQRMELMNALYLEAPAGHGSPMMSARQARHREQDLAATRFQHFLAGRRQEPQQQQQPSGSTAAARTRR